MYKVFLIDDEPMILEGLKMLLNWEDIGLCVSGQANNGMEALDYLKDNPCDIIISDIMMPKMTGLEFIEAAKKINPEMKFIVLSGYQDFEYVKKGILLGVENYLLKPICDEELCATLRNIVEKLNANKPLSPDRKILRDNVIWRWINEDIEEGEMRQRLKIYNLMPAKKCYHLVGLEVERSGTSYYDNIQSLRERIEDETSAILVIEPHDREFIVWTDQNDEDVNEEYNKVLQILSSESYIKEFVLTEVVPIYDINKPFAEYKKVCDLLNLKALLSENERIISSEKLDAIWKVQKTKKISDQELLEAIVHINEDGVERSVRNIFGETYSNDLSEDMKIKSGIALDLILTIKKRVYEYSSHSETNQVIQAIIKCNDVNKIEEILLFYCRNVLEVVSNKNDTLSPVIKSIVSYVESNIAEEISLKTLSYQFNINNVYLGQLFQKEMNVVFSDYLNIIRIEKAKSFLKDTNHRAGDISKMVGYSDAAYFYKKFKKSVGLTPSEYRSLKN